MVIICMMFPNHELSSCRKQNLSRVEIGELACGTGSPSLFPYLLKEVSISRLVSGRYSIPGWSRVARSISFQCEVVKMWPFKVLTAVSLKVLGTV